MSRFCVFLCLAGFTAADQHRLLDVRRPKPEAERIFVNADVFRERVITIGEYTGVPACDYGSSAENITCSEVLDKHLFAPCKYDQNCLLFGDCCYEYITVCLGVNMTKLTSQQIENIAENTSFGFKQDGLSKNKLRMKQYMECLSFSDGGTKMKYWFITRCPENTTSSPDDVLDCEVTKRTFFGSIPVTLITNPVVAFANLHCAVCHGFSGKQVRFWETQSICKGMNDTNISFNALKKYVSNGNCSLEIKSTSINRPRNCILALKGKQSVHARTDHGLHTDTGRERSSETATLCSLYLYPIQVKSLGKYRNPHCFGETFNTTQQLSNEMFNSIPQHHRTQWRCSWGSLEPRSTVPVHPTARPSIGTLSVLFSFSDNSVSLHLRKKTLQSQIEVCPHKDEVYMTYRERCIKLKCNDLDRKPVNGTCVLKEKLIVDGQGQVYPLGSCKIVIRLHVKERHLTDQLLKSHTFKYFMKHLSKKQNRSASTHRMEITTYHDKKEISTITLLARTSPYIIANIVLGFQRFLSKKVEHLHIRCIELSNFETSYGSVDNGIKQFFTHLQRVNKSGCPNGSFSHLEYSTKLVTTGDKLYAKSHGVFFSLENVPFQMVLNERSDVLPDESNVILCLPGDGNDTLPCDVKDVLRASDFTLENGSLVSGGLILGPENYSLTEDGSAVICNIFTRQYRTFWQVVFFDYDSTQKTLTAVTSPVSMLCLLSLLLIYCLLPELRNVPGKIVMSLSTSLLLAQILMSIVHQPTGKLCTAVAIIAHFTWLSSFIWMTMLSVDLVVSLWSLSPIKDKNTGTLKSKFLVYVCLALGIPAAFVIFCVLMDHFNVSGIEIGYGRDHKCWITNKKAVLCAFVIPFAFTLLINIVCFVLSLISIERTVSMISGMSNRCRNEQTRLGVYVRMFFVMGIPWVVAFVAAFANVKFLWWFHIVLNDLQGVFIFLSFVCKPRTFKRLKMKMVPASKKAVVIKSINMSQSHK